MEGRRSIGGEVRPSEVIAELKRAGAKQGVAYVARKRPEAGLKPAEAIARGLKLPEMTSAVFFQGERVRRASSLAADCARTGCGEGRGIATAAFEERLGSTARAMRAMNVYLIPARKMEFERRLALG